MNLKKIMLIKEVDRKKSRAEGSHFYEVQRWAEPIYGDRNQVTGTWTGGIEDTVWERAQGNLAGGGTVLDLDLG